MRLNFKIFSLIFVGLLISACATAPRYRAHPQLNTKIEKVKTITVIPLTVDVYQVTAGGVKEKMDERIGYLQEAFGGRDPFGEELNEMTKNLYGDQQIIEETLTE